MASSGSLTASRPLGRLRQIGRERLRAWWGSARVTFGWSPLLVVLGIGLAVRVYALLAYPGTPLEWYDPIRFARVGMGPFDDVWAPAGYPAFLALLRQLSTNISFTIAVQHLLGLISGLVMYATVRRVAPRWVALVPCAVLVLGGDYLYLETTLLSETYLTFMLCLTLYAAIRALDDEHPLRWLGIASFLAGMAALVRSNALVIPVVLAAWTLFAFGGPLGRRGIRLGVTVAPAVILLVAYSVIASVGSHYAGLTDESNLDLYGRVAPFANCAKFTPPKGTEKLCETTPRGQREGPYWYSLTPGSPGLKYYGSDPKTNGPLGKFARAAILGQPLDYARTVTKDMLRYIDPTLGNDYDSSGLTPDAWTFSYRRTPAEEQYIGSQLARRYDGVLPAHMPGVQELTFYQVTTRLSGLFIAGFSLLSIIGLTVARGRLWSATALFAASAFFLYLGPVATLSYDVRYGVPPQAMLAATAALATWAIVLRCSRRGPEATRREPEPRTSALESAAVR